MQVRLVEGLMVEVRLTTPANPLRAVVAIVDVPETGARIVTVVGLAAIVKS